MEALKMFAYNRRKLLEVLGKGTAGIGLASSFLGVGCAKKEAETQQPAAARGGARRGGDFQASMEDRAKSEPPPRSATKKIVALVCGSDAGNCETFVRAAAVGAGELGIPTEIIKASTLNVNVLEGNNDDDVPWIHERTLLDDAALICAVPCYHARANSLFYAINERMLGMMGRNQWMCKIFRVGAVICVGGSGYDGWLNLTAPSVEIYMQHTRKVVDQVNYAFCGLREWNLWMQQGQPLTSNTHKQRVHDVPPDQIRNMFGETQVGYEEWYRMAIERAKQLGRNVANAMNMPIEEVKYLGEESGVSCPLCHCNHLHVPENLPYIYCPVCAIRGTIVTDKDKMKVEWVMEDTKNPRFHFNMQLHHGQYLQLDGQRRLKDKASTDALKASIFQQSESFSKIITPGSA